MGFSAAPVVETERLILRGYRAEDLAESHANWSDPEVVRHISGRASSEEEAWARLLRNSGLWPILGYGYWAVEEKASGRFVGDVGFADFMRAITPSLKGAPEIGWVLGSWAHGRGYATEAARAALAWGEAQWGPRRTVCIIAPENAPSLRVAEKCGYRAFAHTTHHDTPVILLER